MELFFGSEKKGRSEADVQPIRSSYEDQFGKTDWIYARYPHQLTGKKEKLLYYRQTET
jgi:hypothetical protein